MVQLLRPHFPFLLALWAWALIYWGGASQSLPMLDPMTYGALAKRILQTGDWARLHFTTQAFSDFFQHPPLAVWMQALWFKWVGANDLSIRVLPTLAAAATLAMVYRWAKRSGRSAWCGWLAVAILLTSTRYVKYSLQFYLDPFQALAMVAAAERLDDWLRQSPSLRVSRALGGGIWFGALTAAAFMAKGLPALLLPVAAGVCAVFLRGPGWGRWVLGGAIGLAAALLPWFLFLEGGHYVVRYWQDSLSGRAGPGVWGLYGGPTKNLLKQYWPWLAVVPWAGYLWLRRERVRFTMDALPWLFAAGVWVGFSLSPIFVEHWLVILYPFLAVALARELAPLTEPVQRSFSVVCLVVCIGYSLWLLSGQEVHRQVSRDPFRNVVKRGVAACPSVQHVRVSSAVSDIWTGSATVLWYTPARDVHVQADPAASSPSQPFEAVVTVEAELANAAPGWRAVARSSDWVFLAGPDCSVVAQSNDP